MRARVVGDVLARLVEGGRATSAGAQHEDVHRAFDWVGSIWKTQRDRPTPSSQ